MSDDSSTAPTHHLLLMAEDDPADAALFQEMLEQAFGQEYRVVCVDRFQKITEALEQGKFHALILDMNLPDSDGLEGVSQIGEHYPHIPIVILTGNDNVEIAIESLQEGAQDYLTKNHVTPAMLERSVRYARERKAVEERLKQALNDAANTNQLLEKQVKYDPLTGVPNRAYLREVATQVLSRAFRQEREVAMLFFDLDEFKKVNDTFGHLVGDELLRQIAERLNRVVRHSDFMARIGGDEFVILTDTLDQRKDIYPLLKRIERQFRSPFHIDSHEISCRHAVGVSFYPNAQDLDQLIKQADMAMYEAKGKRFSNVCFFSDDLQEQFARVQQLEVLLKTALEQHQIRAVFQPIVAPHKPHKVQLEALARWHHPTLGEISPEEFIPIAESTPVINGITKKIIKDSAQTIKRLQTEGLTVSKVSINVSPSQLSDENFFRMLMKWLEDYRLPPHLLCLELTENQMVKNIHNCKRFVRQVSNQGIALSLDDFGTGYSSVTHLLEIPFDTLKLDRSLVNGIHTHPRNQALIAGIVEMAHRLEMDVVAEGVELPEELYTVLNLGCDHIQGYLYSKPREAQELEGFYPATFVDTGLLN